MSIIRIFKEKLSNFRDQFNALCISDFEDSPKYKKLRNYGMSLFHDGDYDLAIDVLISAKEELKIIAKKREDFLPFAQLDKQCMWGLNHKIGTCYFFKNDFEKALPYLEDILKCPRDVPFGIYHYQLAKSYHETQNILKAHYHAQVALELNESSMSSLVKNELHKIVKINKIPLIPPSSPN